MDKATLDFYRKHKDLLTGRVLEIGSLNVNGSIREVIDIAVGVDLRRGKGVDLIFPVEKLKEIFADESFDACVSAGTLEHVEDWRGFVRVTWDLVKEGGYLVLTIASPQKGRHSYPDDYWRLTNEQIQRIYPGSYGIENLGKKAPVSVGWVVKKEGELGSLDFDPIKVP